MNFREKADNTTKLNIMKRKKARLDRLDRYFELMAFLDDKTNILTLDRKQKQREVAVLVPKIKRDNIQEPKDNAKIELINQRAEDREKVKNHKLNRK